MNALRIIYFDKVYISLYHELDILEWDRGWGNRFEC